MDKQEFSRRAFADPQDSSEEFRQAINDDADNAALASELQHFDKQLGNTLSVGVPDTLVEKLQAIPTQPATASSSDMAAQQETATGSATASPQNKPDNVVKPSFGMGRIAASIAVAVGLGVAMFQYSPTPVSATNLASHAIEHTLHGASFAGVTNEQVSLTEVNAKLADFGGVLTEQIGEIYWANYCDFEGVASLHMVVAGTRGKVNIFLVPNDRPFEMTNEFVDRSLKGRISQGPKGHAVIVGEIDEPLAPISNRINNSLNWKA